MEEPIRVSLVFPRSGQQLYVHVPRQLAESLQAGGSANGRLRNASLERRSGAAAHDDQRRQP
jgi:hypothetical protein